MARTRSIKPGLFQNDLLAELPLEARYMFPGLWCLADREGRLEDRPKKIKAAIFPFDDIDVDSLLQMLSEKGFIVRYQVEDKKYIQVVNFTEHQKPHPNETESRIPPVPSTTKVRRASEGRTTKARSAAAKGSSPELRKEVEEEGIAKAQEGDGGAGEGLEPERAVFDHWQVRTGHSGARYSDKRKRLIGERLKEGYSVEELCDAVDGCKHSAYHQGKNEQRTIYDSLELICRDAAHVEKFIGYLREPEGGQQIGKESRKALEGLRLVRELSGEPPTDYCDDHREIKGVLGPAADGTRGLTAGH